MKKIKSIHFTGIKGVGMTPLAIIAKEAGFEVTGSDVSDVYITDEVLQKAGVSIFSGFSEDHVKGVGLVIATGAHGGYNNPEVIAARRQGTAILMQGEAVGKFMDGSFLNKSAMEGVSVAGCHGKTTTTAMVATLLKSAGKDPSYVVGTGNIPSLGSSGHFGKGNYFVAEADEYATEPNEDKTAKFLWQHPKIAVITNIEYDHPDLYPTFASLVETYKKFVLQVLDEGGQVITYCDDPQIQQIVKDTTKHIVTYGYDHSNEYVISDVEQTLGGMVFSLTKDNKRIGTFSTSVMGEHNVLNATAAILVGLQAGLSIADIQKGLLTFVGTKRRLEFVGNTKNGAAVFDDYAHHPTEIQTTLRTLRDRYPDSRILCVFQPHTYSRTKLLFKEFCASFSAVDEIIFTDIYASQREPFDDSISSKNLAEKTLHAHYLPSLSDVIHYLEEKKYGLHAIIITMGAGDVYKIAYEIVEK